MIIVICSKLMIGLFLTKQAERSVDGRMLLSLMITMGALLALIAYVGLISISISLIEKSAALFNQAEASSTPLITLLTIFVFMVILVFFLGLERDKTVEEASIDCYVADKTEK